MPYTRSYLDRHSFRKIVRTANGTSFDITLNSDLIGFRSGERVQNWKSKIRSGSDATSPMSSDRMKSVSNNYGSFEVEFVRSATPQVKRKDSLEGYVSPISSTVHLTGLPFLTADNQALMRAHKKVRHESSHLNGMAFAGELRETIKMLRSPYSSVVGLLNTHLNTLENRKRGVRGGSTRKRKETYKQIVASTWLETNFGLMPLIKDTKDIAEAIARYEWLPARKSKIVARSDEVESAVVYPTTVGSIGSGNHIAYYINEAKQTTYSRQYVVGLSTALTADYAANRRLLTTLGFSLENFVPALWEVLPWSWLADYFGNIGNILEASTTCQSGVAWVSRTDLQSTNHTRSCVPAIKETQALLLSDQCQLVALSGDSLGSHTLVRRSVTRIKGTQLGIPVFQVSGPDYWKQWANMSAVLMQRRKTAEQFAGR